jgi:hypothetical protein
MGKTVPAYPAPARNVELPCVIDARGRMTIAEGERQVPFPIRRVFFLYDTAPGAERGHHAHRACHQFMIALAGRVVLDLDDGRERQRLVLDDPTHGVHVPPMNWVALSDFVPGTVVAVLASEPYDAADYIRDRDAFLAALAGGAP